MPAQVGFLLFPTRRAVHSVFPSTAVPLSLPRAHQPSRPLVGVTFKVGCPGGGEWRPHSYVLIRAAASDIDSSVAAVAGASTTLVLAPAQAGFLLVSAQRSTSS